MRGSLCDTYFIPKTIDQPPTLFRKYCSPKSVASWDICKNAFSKCQFVTLCFFEMSLCDTSRKTLSCKCHCITLLFDLDTSKNAFSTNIFFQGILNVEFWFWCEISERTNFCISWVIYDSKNILTFNNYTHFFHPHTDFQILDLTPCSLKFFTITLFEKPY